MYKNMDGLLNTLTVVHKMSVDIIKYLIIHLCVYICCIGVT
jgi:hypothetical protein